MPTELNEIVSITITTTPTPLTQTGFGIPLILGVDQNAALGTTRVGSYASLAEMVADGWLTTDPEYKAAAKMLAQDPAPPTFKVGRRALKPTLRWKITPTAGNATLYKMKINETEVSFTSDASGTVTEIIAGLKAAIDALSLGVTVSDQTTYMRILANTAGAWFQLSVSDPALLSVEQDHADPGVATDLDAILAENADWFDLVSVFSSSAEVAAIAAWAETAKKLYHADTQDSRVELTGTSDIASTLKTSAYKFTAPFYHRSNGEFFASAVAGQMSPKAPGSYTYKFKTPAGVAAMSMTSAQRGFCRAKYANFICAMGGRNMVQDGQCSSGDFIDSIIGREWFKARLQERTAQVLANADKIPFTDAGAAALEGEARAQIKEGLRVGYIASSPTPTVSVPAVSSVSSTNKGNRLFPDVAFSFTEAGAIHKTTVNGTISV